MFAYTQIHTTQFSIKPETTVEDACETLSMDKLIFFNQNKKKSENTSSKSYRSKFCGLFNCCYRYDGEEEKQTELENINNNQVNNDKNNLNVDKDNNINKQ